jgi:hypothetical protein
MELRVVTPSFMSVPKISQYSEGNLVIALASVLSPNHAATATLEVFGACTEFVKVA